MPPFLIAIVLISLVCGSLLGAATVVVIRLLRFRKYLRSENLLLRNVALGLKSKGEVEVLANMYFEFYLLKKQLMQKGLIEPEANYLLGEIYESFAEYDKKRRNP